MRYKGLEQVLTYRNGIPTKALEIREIKDEFKSSEIYVHIVERDGETLMNLSDRYYSDFRLWYVIADKNPSITNPFDIKAKTKIVIPTRI